MGELHSLTDWQVSEASEDAELEDFCHAAAGRPEERTELVMAACSGGPTSTRPATRPPPGPQLRAPAAERSTRAHTTSSDAPPRPRPILRMSDRPAAGGLDVWARERETGRQQGVWREQLAGGVGFLRRAGLGKGGVQSSLRHLFS